MNRCKFTSAFLFAVSIGITFAAHADAQTRQRVIPPNQPNERQQTARTEPKSEPVDLREDYQRPRPTLTNNIVVNPNYQPLVKKTVSSKPTASSTATATANYTSRFAYNAMFSVKLINALQTRMGKPYVYGSSGPNAYDCSGLIWSIFQEAGFSFERTSARSIWQMSEPVEGDDRYKMGTLIFFNGLAHIGIVADANGFYHASTSQGVTYSRFDGYWKNKIVGYRRLKIENKIAIDR